eukprot:6046693-Ditylum_brightwellii.AAC.1
MLSGMKECVEMSESKPTNDCDVSSDGLSIEDSQGSSILMRMNNVQKAQTGTHWLIPGAFYKG